MIEDLLPARVASAEAFGDLPEAVLFPEEEALVARAVPKRRAEFTTARHCARSALAEIDIAPGPILIGPNRAPLWPAGVVGTITHCAGYRAAAVASTQLLASIGVDAEPHGPLPAGVLQRIALPPEIDHINDLTATFPHVCWDRLLFCAKEAVYKAWYPLTQRWLGFEEAQITVRPETNQFTAWLVTPTVTTSGDRLAGFCGRWLARDGLIITGVAVEQGNAPD